MSWFYTSLNNGQLNENLTFGHLQFGSNSSSNQSNGNLNINGHPPDMQSMIELQKQQLSQQSAPFLWVAVNNQDWSGSMSIPMWTSAYQNNYGQSDANSCGTNVVGQSAPTNYHARHLQQHTNKIKVEDTQYDADESDVTEKSLKTEEKGQQVGTGTKPNGSGFCGEFFKVQGSTQTADQLSTIGNVMFKPEQSAVRQIKPFEFSSNNNVDKKKLSDDRYVAMAQIGGNALCDIFGGNAQKGMTARRQIDAARDIDVAAIRAGESVASDIVHAQAKIQCALIGQQTEQIRQQAQTQRAHIFDGTARCWANTQSKINKGWQAVQVELGRQKVQMASNSDETAKAVENIRAESNVKMAEINANMLNQLQHNNHSHELQMAKFRAEMEASRGPRSGCRQFE